MMRAKWVFGAVIAAGTLLWLPPGSSFAQTPAQTATPSDLDRQISLLTLPDTPQDQRDEAARRLLSRGGEKATQAIDGALRDVASPQAQLSAARAISTTINPSPAWIDPVFALLKNSSSEPLTRAAAAALSQYNTRADVLQRLADAANRRTDDAMRLSSIEAIGHFSEKDAAQLLVGILTQPNESARAMTAAATALETLTGIQGSGRDTHRWVEWWEANSAKTREQFRTDLLAERAQRLDNVDARLKRLNDETEVLLRDWYRDAAPERRAALLLQFLSSPAAEIRAMGARQALQDVAQARPVPEAVIARLRDMVGDSDERVRLATINALQRINDPGAFEALLVQLSQESSPDVRAAIARALGPLGDVSAAPQLVQLLDDQSTIVVRAAADAIKDLGPQLREKKPEQCVLAAEKLRRVLQTTDAPGLQELRESVVDAMVLLGRGELLDVFRQLVLPRESARVRRNAVKGIAEIGDRREADRIAPLLTDPERTVQLETVIALGKLGAVEWAPNLVNLIDGGTNDESIRDAAWQSLNLFLPELKTDQLAQIADRFTGKDWGKRLIVLKTLAAKQLAAKSLDEWADTQMNIGKSQEELGAWEEAAAAYQQALQQKLQQPSPQEIVIERLVSDRMRALLRSGKYPDAMIFAAEWMQKNPGFQQTMGTLIRAETERLRSAAGDRNNNDLLQTALNLIAEARKLKNPELPKLYQDQLNDIEGDIRSRMAKQGDKGTVVPPQRPGADATAGTVLE